MKGMWAVDSRVVLIAYTLEAVMFDAATVEATMLDVCRDEL